jgi:hypothetical protein
MTQQQIAIEYIKEFGSMLPAKIPGFFYKGHVCGSEMSKRCRELRKKGILRSEKDGKFERYYLNVVQNENQTSRQVVQPSYPPTGQNALPISLSMFTRNDR